MAEVFGWLIGIVILVGAVVFRAVLAERLARLFTGRQKAGGGTKFEMLPEASGDSDALARWKAPQEEFEAAGFAWVGDCRMQGAGFPHCIRLMQRHHQTFASLVHLVPSGGPALYCELFTPFTDGTTVTTTTSRFGSKSRRPSEYALEVLPPDTDVPALLAQHDATVSGKTGRVRDVMTVPSVEDLFALWRQVDRALQEYRQEAGVLAPGGTGGAMGDGSSVPQRLTAVQGAGPKASPPQVKLAATEERQVEFRTQMAEALQEAYPEIQLVEKGPLILEGRYRTWHDTLDLEKPFAGYLDDPVRKSFIIASFVSNLGTALGHGKDGG